jgi:hypothetical protein
MVARERGFPIRADHCFQRVFLDIATGGVWYDAIKGRPAYAHAQDAILTEALRLAEAVLAGEVDLDRLNERSLGWRAARKRAG